MCNGQLPEGLGSMSAVLEIHGIRRLSQQKCCDASSGQGEPRREHNVSEKTQHVPRSSITSPKQNSNLQESLCSLGSSNQSPDEEEGDKSSLLLALAMEPLSLAEQQKVPGLQAPDGQHLPGINGKKKKNPYPAGAGQVICIAIFHPGLSSLLHVPGFWSEPACPPATAFCNGCVPRRLLLSGLPWLPHGALRD